MEKFWKLYESENSESLDDHLLRHIEVIALKILQDHVKYISKETFYETYYLHFSCDGTFNRYVTLKCGRGGNPFCYGALLVGEWGSSDTVT